MCTQITVPLCSACNALISSFQSCFISVMPSVFSKNEKENGISQSTVISPFSQIPQGSPRSSVLSDISETETCCQPYSFLHCSALWLWRSCLGKPVLDHKMLQNTHLENHPYTKVLCSKRSNNGIGTEVKLRNNIGLL